MTSDGERKTNLLIRIKKSVAIASFASVLVGYLCRQFSGLFIFLSLGVFICYVSLMAATWEYYFGCINFVTKCRINWSLVCLSGIYCGFCLIRRRYDETIWGGIGYVGAGWME